MRKVMIFIAFGVTIDLNGQDLFDSLKNVYSDQAVFPKRRDYKKVGIEVYLEEELQKIQDRKTRQTAITAMVSSLYGFGWIDNQYLIDKLAMVINEPVNSSVQELAHRVKSEITTSIVDKQIQEIVLPNHNRDSISLSDCYANYDFVIIDLWATWCGPCIAEMKKFNDYRRKYNIEFYSISFDDDKEKVVNFIKKNSNYTWPIVFAGRNSTLWEYFRIRQLPAYYIVDKDGIVISNVFRNKLEEEIDEIYDKSR